MQNFNFKVNPEVKNQKMLKNSQKFLTSSRFTSFFDLQMQISMNFTHFSCHFLKNFNSPQLAKNSRVDVFDSSWLQLVPTQIFSELTQVGPTRIQTMLQIQYQQLCHQDTILKPVFAQKLGNMSLENRST